MNILFPNASIKYPPITGGDTHRYQVIKNLVELGHEVHTFYPDENPHTVKHPKKPLPALKQVRAADVIYCRLEVDPNAATNLTYPPKNLLIRGKTVVVWEFNLSIVDSPLLTERTEEEISAALARLKKSARRVDAAICVAKGLADQVRGLLGIEHAHVLQNAADIELFRRDIPAPPDFQLDPQKLHAVATGSNPNSHHDPTTIYEAARLASERELPLEFHVFGRCDSMFPAERPPKLHLHGAVPYTELPSRLAQMDVGLTLYSKNIDNASPLKLFDFLASGCVPICSEAQPVREVLDGHDAGFVGDWNGKSLCDKLMEFKQNPQRLEAIRANGRRLVEDEYNWRRVTEKTVEIFESALRRRNGR